MNARLSIVLLLSATAAACGTTSGGPSMGIAARLTGSVTMINPDPDTTISGLTFFNDGDDDITIQGLTDTLVGGGGTSNGMSGFGVAAHNSTDVLLFDV